MISYTMIWHHMASLPGSPAASRGRISLEVMGIHSSSWDEITQSTAESMLEFQSLLVLEARRRQVLVSPSKWCPRHFPCHVAWQDMSLDVSISSLPTCLYCFFFSSFTTTTSSTSHSLDWNRRGDKEEEEILWGECCAGILESRMSRGWWILG